MQSQLQASSGQPAPNLVKLLGHRSTCYKLGLVGLLASFALFLLGFTTFNWIKPVEPREATWYGLWNIDCELYLCNTSLLITRVFFAFFAGTYLVSLGTAIHENRKKVDPYTYHSRRLELILILTGITGIFALATFSFLYEDSVEVEVGWSMTITVLSLVVVFVVLVIFLCANNKPIQGAGRIISLNRPQAQQQAQQPFLLQQMPQPMPAPPNHMYAAQQHAYPLMNAYQAPQYPPQSQPLLPPPQPYPQPYPQPPPMVPNAPPPPYSMPPAYPGDAQVPYSYPTQSDQGAELSKASAPPME